MHNDDFYDNNNLPMADQGAMLAKAGPFGPEVNEDVLKEKPNELETLLDLLYQWAFQPANGTFLRRKAITSLATFLEEQDMSRVSIAAAYQLRCGLHHRERIKRDSELQTALEVASGLLDDEEDDEEEDEPVKTRKKGRKSFRKKVAVKPSSFDPDDVEDEMDDDEPETIDQKITALTKSVRPLSDGEKKFGLNVDPEKLEALKKQLQVRQEKSLSERILKAR